MSALDQLLENEHASCNGETIRHPCGMTSRRKRVAEARSELSALRSRVASLEATMLAFLHVAKECTVHGSSCIGCGAPLSSCRNESTLMHRDDPCDVAMLIHRIELLHAARGRGEEQQCE